jgi:hypothetical protein
MLLDMTPDEVKELYQYIQVLLGGEEIGVDITEKEVWILARRALKDFLYEIHQWQIRNQFSNIVGTNASRDFTNKFIYDNTMIAQRISDWFASMVRVGGKIPWKKDYFVLEKDKQIYDLTVESSVPYVRGERRIHRIMWYGPPEIFGSATVTGDITNLSLFSFGQYGLSYGNSPLMYLGNLFDVVLLAQALEMRSKVLRSEFFYNISGDIVELTPGPGSPSSQGWTTGGRVYYYYMDEQDFLGLDTQESEEVEELIANPAQVKISNIPYSKLNDMAKSWIDNYTLALAKYVQGAKWRKVRTIASPNSEYQVEFDYQGLIEESKQLQEDLKLKLQEHLLQYIDTVKQFEDKASIAENAAKINRFSPRKWFLG